MTIQAIYDKDHGRANEGWYVRVNDGTQERDIPFEARRNSSDKTIRRNALRAAREEFNVPRGQAVEVLR